MLSRCLLSGFRMGRVLDGNTLGFARPRDCPWYERTNSVLLCLTHDGLLAGPDVRTIALSEVRCHHKELVEKGAPSQRLRVLCSHNRALCADDLCRINVQTTRTTSTK